MADPSFPLLPLSFLFLLSLSLSLSLSAARLFAGLPATPPACQPSTFMQLNFACGRGALVCQPASHANPIVSILSGHELAARRAHLKRARSGRARRGVAVIKNSRHTLSCGSAGGACELKEPRPPKAREGGIHRRGRTSRRCCDPQKPPTPSQGVSKSEDREEPQPG